MHSLVDEAEEHVALAYVVTIPEDYVRVPVGLAEEELLDNVAVLARACAGDHHELVAVELPFNDLQFGLDEVQLFLKLGYIGHEIVVIDSHDVELINLLMDEPLLHIEVL